MAEIDFDKLITAAANPGLAGNLGAATTFTGQVTDALDKADKVLNVVERILGMADRSSSAAALIKMYAQKAGVDLNTSLPAPPVPGIKPTSASHELMFQQLNCASDAEIREIAQVIQSHFQAKKAKEISAPAEEPKDASAGAKTV